MSTEDINNYYQKISTSTEVLQDFIANFAQENKIYIGDLTQKDYYVAIQLLRDNNLDYWKLKQLLKRMR